MCVWMGERAAIYDRRIADRVAFKIDPVFRRFANAKPLRTMCVSLPFGARSRIRGCLRVLRSAPKRVLLSVRDMSWQGDICIICWFMRAAHVIDPRHLSACIWVTAISYESRRAADIDTSMISIADAPDDAMQCHAFKIDPLSFISLLCALSANGTLCESARRVFHRSSIV